MVVSPIGLRRDDTVASILGICNLMTNSNTLYLSIIPWT